MNDFQNALIERLDYLIARLDKLNEFMESLGGYVQVEIDDRQLMRLLYAIRGWPEEKKWGQ